MGGGAAMAAAGGVALMGRDSEACRQARLENRPDVAQVCGRSGGSSGSSHSSSGGGSSGSGDSASSTSRGGFGSAGHVSGS